MQFLTRRKILVLFIAVMFMLPLRGYAQDQSQLQLSEQKIKAGLIYNFLKYTEWPVSKAEAPAPLTVCIFGTEDPFNGYLQPIEDRTVNQRKIKLRHISKIEESTSCHMLFVNADEQTEWPALQHTLVNRSVLTVGDFPGFSNAGGMLEFSTGDNRIQILLNIDAVNKTHLRIFDNLRRLAKTSHSSSGGAE
jgi:hypothetical protein